MNGYIWYSPLNDFCIYIGPTAESWWEKLSHPLRGDGQQVMMGGHLWVGIWLMKNECTIRSLEKPDNSRVLLKSRYSMSGTKKSRLSTK